MKKVELRTGKDLETVTEASFDKPVVLFKHSTRCPVSAMALSGLLQHPRELIFFLINVIDNRDLSNWVAAKFGVLHQSPQILIIHKGACAYHTSHMNIDPAALEKELIALETK